MLVQLLLMVSPLHKPRVLHLLLQVQAPPHQIYLQELPHHPALVCTADLLLSPTGHIFLLRPRTPGFTQNSCPLLFETMWILCFHAWVLHTLMMLISSPWTRLSDLLDRHE
jgi:hypothetical protein